MKVYLGLPKAGKTRRMLALSAETGAVLVVRDRERVRSALERARRMDLKIPQPITYAEFISGDYVERGTSRVIVDDVEGLVMHLARVPVEALTVGTCGQVEIITRQFWKENNVERRTSTGNDS